MDIIYNLFENENFLWFFRELIVFSFFGRNGFLFNFSFKFVYCFEKER